ncbi:hypothetical protein HF329_11730 [Chitinophaga oryzae]|uniref:Uncharacterized protein n=1 Tax=Chitinophaga oryzae TaxID=2725414 RepID=A0AAE6ZFW1_9BACT|nr:hypothetical protein [Chitinophaga oryzae]QJB31961.1 hypothetical protein HF329_11730 [Chitinophaga oryzae]
MSYYKDAQMAIPQGEMPVMDLHNSSPLQAASLNNNQPVWQSVFVNLCQQADNGQSTSVFVLYGSNQKLVTSMDQLFLLSTGLLIRASKLVPGTHELMDKDGNPVAIMQVSMGTFGEPLYRLAANPPYAGNPDGHLLLANGVIAGDFILNMNAEELTAKGFVADPQAASRV